MALLDGEKFAESIMNPDYEAQLKSFMKAVAAMQPSAEQLALSLRECSAVMDRFREAAPEFIPGEEPVWQCNRHGKMPGSETVQHGDPDSVLRVCSKCPRTLSYVGDHDCFQAELEFFKNSFSVSDAEVASANNMLPYSKQEIEENKPEEFQREDRYLVLKADDIKQLPLSTQRDLDNIGKFIDATRKAKGKAKHKYVVISDQWGKLYESAWVVIEEYARAQAEICSFCNGKGSIAYDMMEQPEVCHKCNGKGLKL